MLSVRITAAGAVFVCCASFLTAPARACDDRYLGKCEKAAAAQAAEEGGTATSAKRSAKRVKVVAAARQSRHARLRQRQAPRFATRFARHVALDESERRPQACTVAHAYVLGSNAPPEVLCNIPIYILGLVFPAWNAIFSFLIAIVAIVLMMRKPDAAQA